MSTYWLPPGREFSARAPELQNKERPDKICGHASTPRHFIWIRTAGAFSKNAPRSQKNGDLVYQLQLPNSARALMKRFARGVRHKSQQSVL